MNMTNDVHSLIAELRKAANPVVRIMYPAKDNYTPLEKKLAKGALALADDAEKMLGLFGAFLDEVDRKGRRWVPRPNSGGEYVYDELATKARALKAESLEGK